MRSPTLGVKDLAMPATPERVWRRQQRWPEETHTLPSTINVPPMPLWRPALQGTRATSPAARAGAGDEAPVVQRAPRRSRRHRRELQGHQAEGGAVAIGAMSTHASVAASAEEEDHPRRWPNWPAASATDGAQHGHDRRLDRQRRPGGRLPGRRAGIDDHREPTSAASRLTTSSPACIDGAQTRRADHAAVSFPPAQRRPWK